MINFDIWYISLHFRWIKEPGYLQEYIQFITIPKNYNNQKNMGLNIHVLKFNSLKLHRGWYMYIKVQAYLHRWALHLTRYRLPDRWFCVWTVLFHWSIQTANKGIVFVGCVQVFNKSQISKGYLGDVFVLPESVPPSGNYARQKHLKRETKRPVAKWRDNYSC